MRSSILNFEIWRGYRQLPLGVRHRHLGMVLAAVGLFIVCAELLRSLLAGYQYPSIRERAVAALSDQTEVLFLGNSVVEANIDPRAYAYSVVGLPMANGNYEIDQMLLDAHLDKTPQLKAVVLEADVTCVGWDRIGITRDFLAFEQLGLSIWDIPRPWPFRAGQAFIESRWIRPYLFLPRLTPYEYFYNGWAKPPQEERLPGYTPLTARLLEPDIGRYFATETNRTPVVDAVVDRNFAALDAIVDALHQKQIQVIFVRYPSRGGYAFFKSPEWDVAFSRLESKIRQWERQGVVYWDFSQDARFPTELFRDTIHLNARGAQKMGEVLMEKLPTVMGPAATSKGQIQKPQNP